MKLFYALANRKLVVGYTSDTSFIIFLCLSFCISIKLHFYVPLHNFEGKKICSKSLVLCIRKHIHYIPWHVFKVN